MLDNTHVARNFRPGDVYIYIYTCTCPIIPLCTNTHTHIYIYIYVYIHIHVCMPMSEAYASTRKTDGRRTDMQWHADSDVEGIHEDG